jgi:hypothetical protein
MGNGTANDLLSTISSVVGAVVSLITLLTVYVAALQVLSRRQTYRLGLSERSLGPWKSKVASPSLLRMQTRISTPTISLPKLVASKWEPNFTFPLGFPGEPPKAASDPEAAPVRDLAEASWVNFLEALGLTPESDSFYEMQSEADLVNGIVPMRWKGKDLVAICSMLGFQSHQNKPDFKAPMPLPMLLSGPLGWLQFRANSDGCIVEFRRGMILRNQLSHDSHEYYQKLTTAKPRSPCLVSRLWLSINGMYLKKGSENEKGEVLFIGLADRRRKEQDDKLPSINDICEAVMKDDIPDEDIKKMLWGKKSKRSEALRSSENGLSQRSPSDPLSNLFSGLSKKLEEGKKKNPRLEVLNPCPGLLSRINEGECADSRGLNIFDNCHEFARTFTDSEDVNRTSHPYNISGLCMDEDTLRLLKQAILQLRPDGFYFIASPLFHADHRQIRCHIDKQANSTHFRHIFSEEQLKTWRTETRYDSDPKNDNYNPNNLNNSNNQLYNAMALCNELLNIMRTSQATFTIDDMKLISQVSESLRQIVKGRSSEPISPLSSQPAGSSLARTLTLPQWRSRGQNSPERSWLSSISLLHKFPRNSSVGLGKVVQRQTSSAKAPIGEESPCPTNPVHANSPQSSVGTDLIWAITTSPDVFSDLVARFGRMEVPQVLTDTAYATSCGGVLNCNRLPGGDVQLAGEYKVHLMPDGTFSGVQVLAAFLDVFLTYFWIDGGYPSNTYLYDASIPQSVTMC